MKYLVIGGSKGIGKGIYDLLFKTHTVEEMSRSSFRNINLSWPDEVIHKLVKESIARLGGLDGLIISGGMGAYVGPLESTTNRAQELMQTNFYGPIQCFYAAQKALIKSRGKVLFIGSTVVDRGAKSLGLYAASKAAVEGWVRSECRGYAKHGVSINVLRPGWIDTEMTQSIKPELKEAIIKSIPLRRMGNIDEIASFAVSMLSASEFLTGSVIDMAGG